MADKLFPETALNYFWRQLFASFRDKVMHICLEQIWFPEWAKLMEKLQIKFIRRSLVFTIQRGPIEVPHCENIAHAQEMNNGRCLASY